MPSAFTEDTVLIVATYLCAPKIYREQEGGCKYRQISALFAEAIDIELGRPVRHELCQRHNEALWNMACFSCLDLLKVLNQGRAELRNMVAMLHNCKLAYAAPELFQGATNTRLYYLLPTRTGNDAGREYVDKLEKVQALHKAHNVEVPKPTMFQFALPMMCMLSHNAETIIPGDGWINVKVDAKAAHRSFKSRLKLRPTALLLDLVDRMFAPWGTQ
jgi:hypothetical protein